MLLGIDMDLGPHHLDVVNRAGQTFRDDEARTQFLQLARAGHQPHQPSSVEPQAVGPFHTDLAQNTFKTFTLERPRLNLKGALVRVSIHTRFNTMKSVCSSNGMYTRARQPRFPASLCSRV